MKLKTLTHDKTNVRKKTKQDAVEDGRLRPVPPSGELDKTYTVFLILPIRSIM